MKSKPLLIALLMAVMVGCSASVSTSHFAAAQSDTAQLQVLSYSRCVAPSNTFLAAEPGDLVVVGEIQNVGSNIVSNATVQGVACGSSGNVLAKALGTVFVFHTLPGRKAPFYIDFTPASGSTGDLSWVSSVTKVAVSVSSVTDTTVAQYPDLAIPVGGAVASLQNNNTYTVVGYVNNNGTETVGDVWVVSTFHISAGTVVALNFTNFLTNSLAPNAKVSFWATPADNTASLSNEIASYTTQVDSLSLTSPAHTSTTSTSTKPFPLIPVLVAVVPVAVATTAFLFLRKRQKLPLPPPPPPINA